MTTELLVDRWREVLAIPQFGFAGMTELTTRGRSWQVRGTGEEIRAYLAAFVERALSEEIVEIAQQ